MPIHLIQRLGYLSNCCDGLISDEHYLLSLMAEKIEEGTERERFASQIVLELESKHYSEANQGPCA
jgi:hypothetical protein